MNIVYIHQYFNHPGMSGSTRSFEIAKRMAERGHKVQVITSRRTNDYKNDTEWELPEGVTIHWLDVPYSNEMGFVRRLWAYISFAFRVIWKVLNLPADLIYATSTPLTVAIPALINKLIRGTPYIFEVRDSWPKIPIVLGIITSPFMIKMAKFLEAKAYQHAIGVIALSPGMQNDILDHNIPPEKILISPNASDNDLFSSEVQVDFTFIPDLNGRKIALYAGAFGIVNNTKYWIETARFLSKESDVIIVMIGDGAEFESAKNLAEEYGLLNDRVFILPAVPKNQIVNWYSKASLALSSFINEPVLWDNSANKFFDALAAGCPVCINYKGWQEEIIENDNIGFVLPASDPEKAASILEIAVSDEKKLSQMGAAAKSLAVNKYDRDKLVDELLNQVEQWMKINNTL